MTQAFYTGISGIRSNQFAIDVVSDNLANISTTGYRGSKYEFASLFESAVTSANGTAVDSSVGIGTRVQATTLDEKNGSLQLSDRSTDLAILGNGWFGVEGAGDPIFTRNGAFIFDADDDLVTNDGLHVLGTMGGNIDGETLTNKLDDIALGDVTAQEKLRFPKTLTYPPEPSSLATFVGNLGSTSEVRTMGAGVVDPQNNKNHLKLTFTQAVPQVLPGSQWDIVATAESLDGETVYDTQVGQAAFNAEGSLISTTLTSINNNGATVAIDLGTGFDGVVALANTDIYSSSSANGTIGGDLAGYSINKNAEVIATFTNGEQSSVGKIAVYHFLNDQGLNRLNGSRFQESSNSGRPSFYTDENGENIIGTDIVNFKLEQSNVEMSYGLTELIILQRSFDANSKSITTSDQMMQKALNMGA